jgi:hypothetical protein
MKNPASLSLVLVLLFCASCSNSLSRDKAKALIQASDQFVQSGRRSAMFVISRDSFNQGVQRGYWESVTPNDAEAHITSAGQRLFSRVMHSVSLQGNEEFSVVTHVWLNSSIVEVTGINGGQVEFTFVRNVDELPPDIRDIFRGQSPFKGSAILALYDDGWRVVQVIM